MDFATAPTSPVTTSRRAVTGGPWTPPVLRLVCLDIDDTLVDFTSAGRRALSVLTGRTDTWPLWDEITEEHVAGVVAGERDYAGVHRRRTARYLAELGMDTEATLFERRRKELVAEFWGLYDDVLPCLDWLRAAGVMIAAVTNASGAHQRSKLASLGLASYFDHVTIAGEIGAAKPDPRMFHLTCQVLECDPSQAVHVGDKLGADAIGARDAGLGGIWLNRGDQSAQVPEGIHVIDDLGVLPEQLVAEFAKVGVGC